MRVPDSMTYNNAIRYMNESKAKMDKLAERAYLSAKVIFQQVPMHKPGWKTMRPHLI